MTGATSTWLDLPLLRRELIETSRGRRLWVIRTVLAALQMLFVVVNYDDLTDATGSIGAFGGGQEIAAVLIICNLIAVYLLLPLTACAAIASERERQTLPLLLISRISAGRLILEKFLGSLIPVLTLMALSLPSLALAYSLGGLSPELLAGSAAAMLVSAVQVTTAAIFWSAVFRTSLQAFSATLVTLLAFLIVPAMLQILCGIGSSGRLFGLPIDISSLFIGFWELPWQVPMPLNDAVMLCLPPLTVGGILLAGAVVVVRRYRCDAPLSRFPNPFRILRKLIKGLINRTAPATSANQTTDTTHSLPPMRVPADRPIAWRECAASATFRPQFFILLALLIPLALWLLIGSDLNFRPTEAFALLNGILLISGALMVLGVGARSFALERDSETLAVLLTTPQPTTELVIQKLAAARRSRLLFMFGLVVLAAIRLLDPLLMFIDYEYNLPRQTFEPLGLLLAWEHLTLVIWVSIAWSLSARTTLRAAVGTLATIFGYCLLHFFAMYLLLEVLERPSDVLATGLPLIAWISIMVDEVPRGGEFELFIRFLLFCSAGLLGVTLILLRIVVLRKAPDWLERH